MDSAVYVASLRVVCRSPGVYVRPPKRSNDYYFSENPTRILRRRPDSVNPAYSSTSQHGWFQEDPFHHQSGIGTWRVPEEVDASSGRLPVYVFRRASWIGVSGLLFRAALPESLHGRTGRRRGPGDVVERPARSVRVESRPEQVAAIDGEVYEGGFPAEVDVDRGALAMVVP